MSADFDMPAAMGFGGDAAAAYVAGEPGEMESLEDLLATNVNGDGNVQVGFPPVKEEEQPIAPSSPASTATATAATDVEYPAGMGLDVAVDDDGGSAEAPCCQATGPCRWDKVCRVHVGEWERIHGGAYVAYLRAQGQVVPAWLEGADPGQRGSAAASAAAGVQREAGDDDEVDDGEVERVAGAGGGETAADADAASGSDDEMMGVMNDDARMDDGDDDDGVGGGDSGGGGGGGGVPDADELHDALYAVDIDMVQVVADDGGGGGGGDGGVINGAGGPGLSSKTDFDATLNAFYGENEGVESEGHGKRGRELLY